MLKSYSKPERIRAEERTKLLRDVGKMVGRIGSYSGIFFDNEMNLLPYERIRAHLLSCSTFSKDPNEKKCNYYCKIPEQFRCFSGWRSRKCSIFQNRPNSRYLGDFGWVNSLHIFQAFFPPCSRPCAAPVATVFCNRFHSVSLISFEKCCGIKHRVSLIPEISTTLPSFDF